MVYPKAQYWGLYFFLLYINDLSSICKYTLPFLFADDTSLMATGDDISQLQNVINQELAAIATWLKVNKLSLNIKKTQFILFTRKKCQNTSIHLNIDGANISQVTETKFLGVYIDSQLNWKRHISYISGKVARGIGILIKARHYLSKQCLVSLYYSFIYPYLIYCNHIWGTAYVSNLSRLTILQKKAVRIICHAKFRSHSDPLFRNLGLLKFIDINRYLFGRFMFRVVHGDVPDIFGGFFRYNRELHEYNTRYSNHLNISTVKSNLRKSCIKFRGAYIWNSILAAGINQNVSDYVFSRQLKNCIAMGIL